MGAASLGVLNRNPLFGKGFWGEELAIPTSL